MTNDQLLEELMLDCDVDRYGTTRYRFNGELHRVHGPACVFTSGTEHWYQHGKLHREDGPAVTHADGSELWYQHDKFIK